MIFKQSEVDRIAHAVRDARRSMPDPLTIKEIVRLTLTMAEPMAPVAFVSPDHPGRPSISPRVREILQEIAAAHGVTAEDILGRSQRGAVRGARAEAMRKVRALSSWSGKQNGVRADPFSFPAIGRIFGRDHSTVFKVCRR